MIGPQITPEQTDDYSFSSDIKNFKEKYSYKIAATTEVIELEMKMYAFWTHYNHCMQSNYLAYPINDFSTLIFLRIF